RSSECRGDVSYFSRSVPPPSAWCARWTHDGRQEVRGRNQQANSLSRTPNRYRSIRKPSNRRVGPASVDHAESAEDRQAIHGRSIPKRAVGKDQVARRTGRLVTGGSDYSTWTRPQP